MNTTTPDEERSEKDGLAREPRELSSEELESIMGGVDPTVENIEGRIEGIEEGRKALRPYYGTVFLISSDSYWY